MSADDKAAVEGKEGEAARVDEAMAARAPAARARKAEQEARGGASSTGGTSQVWRLVYSLWRG